MTFLRRAQKKGKQFINPVPTEIGGFSLMLKVLPKYLRSTSERFPAQPLGPFVTDAKCFDQPPRSGLRVTWFGHSSTLVEIDGIRVLIDPIWERRASPVQFAGPRRFFDPTISLADLPEIDVVLLSHDHYDHLGEATVRTLLSGSNVRGAIWVTSLGVGSLLQRWGVEPARVVELDWTDTHVRTMRGTDLRITSWPARHFSGRKLSNRFETLWASFAIEGPGHSVFYGADSGPWPGFAEIGERHGHFDLVMLEIGAADPLWADIHLGPNAAVAAFEALASGGLLMPIHWGLFDLALHAWRQPIERLRELADSGKVPLWCPEPGLPTEVTPNVEVRSDWWR